MIAAKIGSESRFRSLQIGVCQESFGESIQRNMSWAGRPSSAAGDDSASSLTASSGAKTGWINRKKSVLDRVREDAAAFSSRLGQEDKSRLDEYLSSVRDVERTIASLPPEYAQSSSGRKRAAT